MNSLLFMQKNENIWKMWVQTHKSPGLVAQALVSHIQWTQTPSPDLEFKLINDCRHKRDVDAINWLDWWFNVFKMVWNLFLSNALDLLGTYAYCVICNY